MKPRTNTFVYLFACFRGKHDEYTAGKRDWTINCQRSRKKGERDGEEAGRPTVGGGTGPTRRTDKALSVRLCADRCPPSSRQPGHEIYSELNTHDLEHKTLSAKAHLEFHSLLFGRDRQELDRCLKLRSRRQSVRHVINKRKENKRIINMVS